MFDRLQGRNFVTAHECECVAYILGTARSTDPVNIILRMLWHIVIDDMTYTGDVQSARCDIGRNHYFVFAALESLQRLDAFTLCAIRMQHRHRVLRMLEEMCDTIGILLCSAKNQYAVEICSFQ